MLQQARNSPQPKREEPKHAPISYNMVPKQVLKKFVRNIKKKKDCDFNLDYRVQVTEILIV